MDIQTTRNATYINTQTLESEMTDAEKFKAMALIFERKADACAASSVPWALANLRLYQNKASEFWSKHYAALKAEAES